MSAAQDTNNTLTGLPNFQEQVAQVYATNLQTFIGTKHGRYLQDQDGSLYVVIDGRRIPLAADRNNLALADLMMHVCSVSTVGQAAQAAIQRLQVHAYGQASRLQLRRFSALSKDRKHLYIPLDNGQLLDVGIDGINEVPNGDNAENIWLEHPTGEPLHYEPPDLQSALEQFESLVVNTQACETDAMRWLVAIEEGLFPYIRDACPARLIFIHQGPTQNGKTSGAQRFTLLHGLGQVKGDYSVAALGNMPDGGLIVLDNKEHANLNQDLVDYLLFVATGAERGRSNSDGQIRVHGRHRPVVVITSIEGVFKAELQARCIEIPYVVHGAKRGRGDIERKITEQRHQLVSALVAVLQRYLESQPTACPNPRPEFEEHFAMLCGLLRAYGEVADKPQGWAGRIIAQWDAQLGHRDREEDELENPILEVLQVGYDNQIQALPFAHKGQEGILHVTNAGHLLTQLQKQIGAGPQRSALPRTPTALSRRLGSCRFDRIVLLDADSAPDCTALRRTAHKRTIGLWVATDDEVTQPVATPSGTPSSIRAFVS